MDLGLKDAVVIVQGGSRGMGLAAAECFAADGAKVGILGRTQADLDIAVERALPAISAFRPMSMRLLPESPRAGRTSIRWSMPRAARLSAT